MNCPNCNAEIADNANACSNCGAALPQSAAAPVHSAQQGTPEQALASDGLATDMSEQPLAPHELESQRQDQALQEQADDGLQVGGICPYCKNDFIRYRVEQQPITRRTIDYVWPIAVIVIGIVCTVWLFATQGPEAVFNRSHRSINSFICALPFIGVAFLIRAIRKKYKDVAVCKCPSCGSEYEADPQTIPNKEGW